MAIQRMISACQSPQSTHSSEKNYGKLDVETLSALCRRINLAEACESDVKALLKRIDLAHHGYVTINEFCRFMFKQAGDVEIRAKRTIARMREVLGNRPGGFSKLKSLASQFRAIDRNGT